MPDPWVRWRHDGRLLLDDDDQLVGPRWKLSSQPRPPRSELRPVTMVRAVTHTGFCGRCANELPLSSAAGVVEIRTMAAGVHRSRPAPVDNARLWLLSDA